MRIPPTALACAACVGAPWDKSDLGFFWSALFLMALPVALAGVVGGWLYHARSARRAGGCRSGAAPSPPATAREEEIGP